MVVTKASNTAFRSRTGFRALLIVARLKSLRLRPLGEKSALCSQIIAQVGSLGEKCALRQGNHSVRRLIARRSSLSQHPVGIANSSPATIVNLGRISSGRSTAIQLGSREGGKVQRRVPVYGVLWPLHARVCSLARDHPNIGHRHPLARPLAPKG